MPRSTTNRARRRKRRAKNQRTLDAHGVLVAERRLSKWERLKLRKLWRASRERAK